MLRFFYYYFCLANCFLHTIFHVMFTIEQINAAHAKVQSGADFPQYFRDLVALGVSGYETYVTNGNTIYFGNDQYSVLSGAKYDSLNVANTNNKAQFQSDLRAHQQGKTDYPAFCKDCARSGVEKWVIDMAEMTCRYFDKAGNEILAETIPTA
jgi:uncharacterized protein YbcV (DUF1398 family)